MVRWLALALTAAALPAAQYPEAVISNGAIKARLYLPDQDRGYYRGTRFDWSGIIASLEYKGHTYFGPWFDGHDPRIHDSITGPVEEFRTNDAGLGYDEARPREAFIRIGVGAVRKPEEPRFRWDQTYQIVNPGLWIVRPGSDGVEFVHQLREESGYGYLYQKNVRLAGSKPELTLEHRLKNTGTRPIDTVQYNHNFFVIDSTPVGPAFALRFTFSVRTQGDLKDVAKAGGDQLELLRELQPGENFSTEVEGFGADAKDYDLRVENRKTGAGVRITGDQPLARLAFWCQARTVCPEPYIHLRIEPGREARWTIVYRFYTLGEATAHGAPGGGRNRGRPRGNRN